MTTVDMDTVKVHVVGGTVSARAEQTERVTAYRTFTTTADPNMVLGHNPSRIRAVLYFQSGAGGNSCYVCSSRGDAQQSPPSGMLITVSTVNQTAGPIELRGTDEVWVVTNPGSGAVNVSVASESVRVE